MSVNKHQVKGRINKVKGKIRESAGKVVGNKKLQVRGKVQEPSVQLKQGSVTSSKP